MATTAIPGLFAQRLFSVTHAEGDGVFLDGGLAALGNPSLGLLQLARLNTYGLNWPIGVDALTIVSLGTGRFTPLADRRKAQKMGPIRLGLASLQGFHADTLEQTQRLMAWLGMPLAPHVFDSEVGDFTGDMLADKPMFKYLNVDMPLNSKDLRAIGVEVSGADETRLQSMTDPNIIADLYGYATEWCRQTYDLDTLLP